MTWVETAKQIDLLQVAAELGMAVKDQHLGPCPACGEERRSNSDTRFGPLYRTRKGGWHCQRCATGGDVVDLVSWSLQSRKLDRDGAPAVRTWFAARGWCEPAEGRPVEAPIRPRPVPQLEVIREAPPRDEVLSLWSTCHSITDEPVVCDWLRARALDPSRVEDRHLARVLPLDGRVPPWARHWITTLPCPVMVPLYDSHGLVGLQGRRIDGGAPKSIAAKGVARHGVYACGWGQALLREDLASWTGDRIVIAEGEPDWLTWATWAGGSESAPIVLGLPGEGGWNDALAHTLLSATRGRDVRVVVRTHSDPKGDKYARTIASSLRGRLPVILRPVSGALQVSA